MSVTGSQKLNQDADFTPGSQTIGGTEDACALNELMDGKIVVFGGKMALPDGNLVTNQLWIFDVELHTWELLSGDVNGKGEANYGLLGEADEENIPGYSRDCISWTYDDAFFTGFGSLDISVDNSTQILWKYEAQASAIGDPHITSMWGCQFEADESDGEALLMSCEQDSLSVRFSESWDNHIYEVLTTIDGKSDVYRWNYLKHEQFKTICGNEVRFHRYYSGINLKVVNMRNHDISGLFNDSRCIAGHQ